MNDGRVYGFSHMPCLRCLENIKKNQKKFTNFILLLKALTPIINNSSQKDTGHEMNRNVKRAGCEYAEYE